jgi:hypothetical protein
MRAVQSVLFDIKYYTPQTSMNELLKRGFNFNKIDLIDNQWRYTQREPIKDAKYLTIKKGEGIKYVVNFR